MQQLIESLKKGAPFMAVGAAFAIGGAFMEPGKMDKLIKLGAIAGLGGGALISAFDFAKQMGWVK